MRQGCVMSPWFFNIFFDRVIIEVKLRDWNGRGGKLNKYYMQMTLLTAETREYLQYIVNVLERVCNRMGLKINVGNVGESCEKVKLNGEEMQEIDTFKYIILIINAEEGTGEEVPQRLLEGGNVYGTKSCERRIGYLEK